MQDGFDKNVAEKMPKKLRSAHSRPWNIDPVRIQESSVEEEAPSLAFKKEPEKEIALPESPRKPDVTISAIEDLNIEVTEALFRNKDLMRQVREEKKSLEKALSENAILKITISDLKKNIIDQDAFKKELAFLNEQVEDSSVYIENISRKLTEKTQEIEKAIKEKNAFEAKYNRLSDELQHRAKFEVKSSILEQELGLNRSRVKELEAIIDLQQEKNDSLSQEIKELKETLEKVYTSLSTIRVKAKKEAYGL